MKLKAFFSIVLLFAATGFQRADNGAEPTPVLTVPFEFENNRIRLKMTVNGVELLMLLDSGASTSVVFAHDDPAINDIKVTGGRSILFPALDEAIKGVSLATTEFKLEGMAIQLNDLVRLDDKSNLRARLLLRYDGILGQEFFRKFTVQIDPKKRVMSLYPKGTNLSGLYRTEHTLYLKGDAPHMRFRSKMPWEESPSLKEMLVDTGYPGAIVFWDSSHYRKAAKLTPDARAPGTAIVGRANFRFGRLRFMGTPVYLGAYPPKQVGERDGLIGATMLNNFTYAIDLTGKKMWMLAVSEGDNYSRQFDGTFYPPNDDDYVFSIFAEKSSAGPKTVVEHQIWSMPKQQS